MATLGNTSPGTTSTPNSSDRCWAYKVTLSENGTVTKATVFFDYDAANSSLAGDNGKVLVYADSSGAPGSRVAVSSAVSIPAGDQTLDFTLSVYLTAGDYWLGLVTDSFNSRLNSLGSGSSSYVRKESFTYASPADPFGTPDDSGGSSAGYGIYLTYTPDAAGASEGPGLVIGDEAGFVGEGAIGAPNVATATYGFPFVRRMSRFSGYFR
jgi:hypothetical protein